MPDCSPNFEFTTKPEYMNADAALSHDPPRFFRDHYIDMDYDYMLLSDSIKSKLDKHDIK